MEILVLKQHEDNELLLNLSDKLDEETCEVMHAVRFRSKRETASEVLDCIQVCIGMLDKLERDGVDIKKALEEHNKKLLTENPLKPERPWEYKKVIHIDVVGGEQHGNP